MGHFMDIHGDKRRASRDIESVGRKAFIQNRLESTVIKKIETVESRVPFL